ncbi:unnamed protein product [Trichobilharzia regenti]|nr:unnamed protein product [Trichobilharzia regenti]
MLFCSPINMTIPVVNFQYRCMSVLSLSSKQRESGSDGTGGGIIKFSKNYYNLHDIDEPLDRLIPFPNEEELNSLLKLQSNTDTSNNNNNKLIETENIHWIILGGVLGGALVIMIVITMVLLSRCRRAKTSTTSLTKSDDSNACMYILAPFNVE